MTEKEIGGHGRKEFEPSRRYLLKLPSRTHAPHQSIRKSPDGRFNFDNSV